MVIPKSRSTGSAVPSRTWLGFGFGFGFGFGLGLGRAVAHLHHEVARVGVGVEEAVDEELLAVDVHQPRHQGLAVDAVHGHRIDIGDLEALSEPGVAGGCMGLQGGGTRMTALCCIGLQAADPAGFSAHVITSARVETRPGSGVGTTASSPATRRLRATSLRLAASWSKSSSRTYSGARGGEPV